MIAFAILFPLLFHALPDTVLVATLARMTSALTTLFPHSPCAPLLLTLSPLPLRRDPCQLEELAATTSTLLLPISDAPTEQ